MQEHFYSNSKKIIIKFQNFINKLLKKFNLRLMKYSTYEKVILNDTSFTPRPTDSTVLIQTGDKIT